MNKELEKLIDYALVDGYITDKEKEVLIKKAIQQGFDIDELEMILEGKQHEKTADSTPKVEKCPSCGEILGGLSKVCPSCDYILDARSKKNTQTLDVALRKLNDSMSSLDSPPMPGASVAISSALLIFLTVGACLIYRKLVHKYAFDKDYDTYKKITGVIELQIQEIRQSYGDDKKTAGILDRAVAELNAKTKKRNTNTMIVGWSSIALTALIYLVISQIPRPAPTKETESAEDKTERLIKSDSIGKAKLAVTGIEDKDTRQFYLEKIMLKEIDSLTSIKDYNAAILLTSKLENRGYMDTRSKKMDSIVSLEVRELVDNKDFTRARERAELAGYPASSELENLIKLSEKIEKDIKKKRKK